jgi:hypothetical protein
MENHEALETGAVVGELSDSVQNQIHDLLSDAGWGRDAKYCKKYCNRLTYLCRV